MAGRTATHATRLPPEEIERVRAYFRPQPYETLADLDVPAGREPRFQAWYRYNTLPHGWPAIAPCSSR